MKGFNLIALILCIISMIYSAFIGNEFLTALALFLAIYNLIYLEE